MREIGKHANLGAAYGELDKNGVTNMDAALFNTQEAEVAGVVKSAIGFPVEDMKRDTAFGDMHNCDSLDVVQIIMDCEEHFDISISDEEAEKIVTLGDLFAVVAKHKA